MTVHSATQNWQTSCGGMCVRVCADVCVCRCVLLCMHVSVQVYVCMLVCACGTYPHPHTNMHIHTHTDMHMYIPHCTRTHRHAHARTNTHAHTSRHLRRSDPSIPPGTAYQTASLVKPRTFRMDGTPWSVMSTIISRRYRRQRIPSSASLIHLDSGSSHRNSTRSCHSRRHCCTLSAAFCALAVCDFRPRSVDGGLGLSSLSFKVNVLQISCLQSEPTSKLSTRRTPIS